MKTKTITALSIILFLASVFLFPAKQQAFAQGLSLSISPPILEVLIKPGKSAIQAYKISNDGDPVILTPQIGELTEAGSISQDPNFTVEKWINTLNTDLALGQPFLLDKGETRQLIVRINPPQGTPEKDYYRVIYFTTTPNPPLESSQSSISQTIGSPLIITVSASGLLVKSAKISKFQIPEILDSFDHINADIEITNTGKTYFHPVGKITLVGPVGRGDYNLVPNAIFIGQTKRLLTTDNAQESQEPSSTITLPGFFLGKYILTVDFTLDQGTTRITQTKIFYAFPWKAGLVIFTFLFFIFFLRRGKRNHGNKKAR